MGHHADTATCHSERRRRPARATTNRREGILGGSAFGLARFFVASLLRMTDALDSLFGLPIGWIHANAKQKRADPYLDRRRRPSRYQRRPALFLLPLPPPNVQRHFRVSPYERWVQLSPGRIGQR